MKCSCELRFWVRKAISQLSSQQLSLESGSCWPRQCPCPLSPGGQSPGQTAASVSPPLGAGGQAWRGQPRGARWEQDAAGQGALGSARLFFLSF